MGSEDHRSSGADNVQDAPGLPGFREMAQRRRELIAELVAQRKAAGLSQTEVAARMGTSQSSVARLEASHPDTRLSTLQRYAGAVGQEIDWELRNFRSGSEPL